jgi:hypothetical protein
MFHSQPIHYVKPGTRLKVNVDDSGSPIRDSVE